MTRIGIDVGGTNTDAVLMDGDTVSAAVKVPTTDNISGGIVEALRTLEGDATLRAVDAVMIGTTHFVNALVEAQNLTPTAAIRLGLPSTSALPPMVAWPPALVSAIQGRSYLAHGGYEFDGRPIAPIDPEEIRRHAGDLAAAGIRSVAVSSVFSPVSAEAELTAAEILTKELGPDVAVSMSHEIGRLGLLERENATIINAALHELAQTIVSGLVHSVAQLGITGPLYLSQNDGTLMAAQFAANYPVSTFASGPTNSMRGAATQSGLSDCRVVDIGGTTTDVGVLINGFPRQVATESTIAGVRTNFRMPDVYSVGIGGGSRINSTGSAVGPTSVGYRLADDALVFGGDTLTATDIAVAAGLADIGDAGAVADLDHALVNRAVDVIHRSVIDAVESMRTSASPLPVVAVGGGAALLPEELPGLGTIHRGRHFAVANAIGAAIAQVSGEVDRVYAVSGRQRAAILDEARQEALDRAIAAGARPDTTVVVDLEETPLPYLPGNATRIRAKAVGELATGGTP